MVEHEECLEKSFVIGKLSSADLFGTRGSFLNGCKRTFQLRSWASTGIHTGGGRSIVAAGGQLDGRVLVLVPYLVSVQPAETATCSDVGRPTAQ